MVDEPRDVALAGSVDEVFGGKRHEVEVLHVIAGVLASPFPELTGVKNLADVLHDEGVTVGKE